VSKGWAGSLVSRGRERAAWIILLHQLRLTVGAGTYEWVLSRSFVLFLLDFEKIVISA
jgi:hypothetical protein